MYKAPLTEDINPNTLNIDLMSSYEIAKVMNNEDKKVAAAVETQLKPIAEAIDLIAKAFLRGGRLAYFGAGTSGRLGVLDASECVPTFGVAPDMVQGFIAGGDKALRNSIEAAEDSKEKALEDVEKFNPSADDVVVGISASGNPKYVITALQFAKEAGCATVALVCNPEAEVKRFADVFICPIVGQEVISGSSRLKAGTAQKMILNMFSTGAMIRIGKTYKNYMVDMQMTNEKLTRRGKKIVAEITGVDISRAEELLKQSDNKIKEACVMAVKNCSLPQAESMLKEAGGILRKVIK